MAWTKDVNDTETVSNVRFRIDGDTVRVAIYTDKGTTYSEVSIAGELTAQQQTDLAAILSVLQTAALNAAGFTSA